jgi:hypothetical protein
MIMNGNLYIVLGNFFANQSQQLRLWYANYYLHTSRLCIIKGSMDLSITIHIDYSAAIQLQSGTFNLRGHCFDFCLSAFQGQVKALKSNIL